jgi:hypothetical protein
VYRVKSIGLRPTSLARDRLTGKPWPADATFLYLFNNAHLQEFGQVPQAWMISQIAGGSESLDQLVCDGERAPTAAPTASA